MSRTRWFGWALAGAAAGGLLLVGLLVAFVMVRLSLRSSPTLAPTANLITQMQSLNELVMVKYVVEKVVKLESEPSLLGEDRVVLLVHAVVKAGVNLSALRPEDVRVQGRRVSLTLPPAQVTDCYIDERRTEVWEHKTRFWRPFDQELEQKARRQALDQIRLGAGEQGIQKEALQRARDQLGLLLKALGFESVEILQR